MHRGGGGVGVRADGEREREIWGELGGMGWLGWRKGGYGSRKVDIIIKGAMLGLARDLTLEGFPGVQGDVPSLFLGQQRRGCLNRSFLIATLMNILYTSIEPHLAMDGDRDRDPHWSTGLSSQGPNEQKEGEHERGSQNHEGCVHPLRRWD